MLGRNEGWIDIPFLGSWAGRRAGPHQAGSQKIDGSFWNGRAPRSCRWAFLECALQHDTVWMLGEWPGGWPKLLLCLIGDGCVPWPAVHDVPDAVASIVPGPQAA